VTSIDDDCCSGGYCCETKKNSSLTAAAGQSRISLHRTLDSWVNHCHLLRF
ncbi:hypothetical protein MKX03_022012, partial [Papaver bracteatum]